MPRPTRWAWARVSVLGMVGAWVIPMPWQRAVADPVPVSRMGLGPATVEWLATDQGREWSQNQPPPAQAAWSSKPGVALR